MFQAKAMAPASLDLYADPWSAYISHPRTGAARPGDGIHHDLVEALRSLPADASNWMLADTLHDAGIPAAISLTKVNGRSKLTTLMHSAYQRWERLVIGLPREDGGIGWAICPDHGSAELQSAWASGGRKALRFPMVLRLGYAAASGRPAHEQTLAKYLRSSQPRVLGQQNFGAFELSMLERAEAEITKASETVWRPANLPYETPGFRVFAAEGKIIVRDRADGALVGGTSSSVVWVKPKYRGRGIGSLVTEAGDLMGYLQPTHFSLDGYRSRLSGHRKAVERALRDGIAVPDDVLAEYRPGDGTGLQRSDPKWDQIAATAVAAPIKVQSTPLSWPVTWSPDSSYSGDKSIRDLDRDWLKPRTADIRSLKAKAQPDGISCGATAVAMALDGLGLLPSGGIRDVMQAIGTNPVTGTVPWAVVEGLKNLGARAEFHGRPSDEGVSSALRLKSLLNDDKGPNFVMLRILAGGYAKHWVIAEPSGRDQIRVLDPASGRTYSGTAKQLAQDWAKRGYEAITIPADRDRHPGVSPARNIYPPSSGMPDPSKVSLAEWLTPAVNRLVIIPPPDFGPQERVAIDTAPEDLRLAAADPFLRPLAVQSKARPDLSFHVVGAAGPAETMVVKDRRSGEPIGGVFDGLTYVVPERRGERIGAEILLVAAANPSFRFVMPYAYSIEGYQTRLSAHKMAVERALDRGDHVPQAVMASYVQDGPGSLRLAKPDWDEFREAAEMSGRRVTRSALDLTVVDAAGEMDLSDLSWPLVSSPVAEHPRVETATAAPSGGDPLDALNGLDWGGSGVSAEEPEPAPEPPRPGR